MDVYKAWMFASSFPGLRPIRMYLSTSPKLSYSSSRPQRRLWCLRKSGDSTISHRSWHNCLQLWWHHYWTPQHWIYKWSSLDALMPIKRLSDYPFAQIDGGGAFSHPDWSQDHRQEHDWFKMLRTSWMNRIISERLDKILLAHVASGNPSPPFSMEILSSIQGRSGEIFVRLMVNNLIGPVRQHQPMHLHILHSLQRIMHDFDFTFLPMFIRRCPDRFFHGNSSIR